MTSTLPPARRCVRPTVVAGSPGVTDVETISHRELERRAGESIDGKKVMFAVGPTIYRRVDEDQWESYPPAPPCSE